MSCTVKLKNGNLSKLHEELQDIFPNEKESLAKYDYFQSKAFEEEFGNFQELRDDPEVAFLPGNIGKRLNEYLEPKLFKDDLGSYYLDKNEEKKYLKINDSKLYNVFKSEAKVNRLVEIAAFDFIKSFNLDFNTLDLSDLTSELSLRDSISNKLESLAEKLSESKNLKLQLNSNSVYEILDDSEVLREFENKVKDFFKTKQLKFVDNNSEENEAESSEDYVKDPSFSQSSFEINTKDKVSSNIKLRLSLISDNSKIDEEFNESMPIAYDEVYKKLSFILANKVALEVNGKQQDLFKVFLDEVAKFTIIPYFKDVHAILEGFNNSKIKKGTREYDLKQSLKAEFVRAFRLHANSFNTTETNYESVVISPRETEPLYNVNGDLIGEKVIKEEVRDLIAKVEVFDAAKNNNSKRDIITSWSQSLDTYFFEENSDKISKDKIDQLNSIKKELKSFNENKSKTRDFEKDLNKTLEIFRGVGVNINENALYYAFNELSFNVDNTKAFYDNKTKQFIEESEKIFSNLIVNKKSNSQLVNTYMFTKQIAEAESFYKEDGSDSSTHTAGKTKWLYSYPSYLSNTINDWKTDRNQLLNKFDKGNAWVKSSILLNHFLASTTKMSDRIVESAKRISKIKLSHFNVYQTKNNKGISYKDGKRISKQEYLIDTINKLLYSKKNVAKDLKRTIARTTTAPGKSTQYEISHDYFFNSSIGYRNGEITVSEEAINLVYDYVKGEFGRMDSEFKNLGKKDNSVYYHTDKKGNARDDKGNLLGNAFKSQILPSLNSNVILQNHEFNIYNENGSINLELVDRHEDKIKKVIEDSISKKVETTVKRLLNDNIIEKVNENSFNNKSIDNDIVKSYIGENNSINADSMYNIAGDIFMNGLINHTEYSKLYAGDVAYYKDSIDYIKRIGATYGDGIYEYLTDENKEFKIAVIESVNIKEPYLEEFTNLLKGDKQLIDSWSELINSADAQAWITPERWKTLLNGTAKWNSKYDDVYDKIIGKNQEPLTKDELKLVAQPLKGTYFDLNDKGVPTFLKYSQAVLIPQLRRNNDLQKIYDLMRNQGVDELLTFDAIKAGSPLTSKIHDEKGNVVTDGVKLNVVTLKSKGWKLQQDLPTKGFKETDLGSQLQKNVILLISHFKDMNAKEFVLGNETYSPLELNQLMDSLQGGLIDKGFESLYNEFGIDSDGRISKVEKFYKSIIEEYAKKGGNESIIKALRAGLSTYGIPGVKEKLDNIFASIVTDRTVKIKTNGASFIQMSNFGLSKNEAEAKYTDGIKWSPKVENGNTLKPYRNKKDSNGNNITNALGQEVIESNQILISGSFIAKYIPNYKEFDSETLFGKFNPETGKLEGGMIDSKILENIIGYRIPNQGPSSNDALEIAGILPETSGDTVVAFTGITKKTGSDFDIDKMYIMFPNSKAIYNKSDEIYNYVNKSLKGAFHAETIANYINFLNEFNNEDSEADVNLIIDALDNLETDKEKFELLNNAKKLVLDLLFDKENKNNPLVKEVFKEFDIKVKALKYVEFEKDKDGNELPISKQSKEAVQNKTIEAYRAALLHPDNISRVMTPLDHEFIKQDAQNISPIKDKENLGVFDLIEDIDTKFSFLAGALGIAQEANSNSDYAMGTMTDYYLENVNLSSRRANTFKREGTKFDAEANDYDFVMKDHTQFDQEYSKPLEEQELKDWLESYNSRASKKLEFEDVKYLLKVPISNTLSALMNAFVDIAKDPYITNINWNMLTTNVGNLLIRGGVHPLVTTSFLAQPIIKEYTEFVSGYESSKDSEQVSDTKVAFQIYKVGETLKDSPLIDLGELGKISPKILYDAVANSVFNPEYLSKDSFKTEEVKGIIKSKLGLNVDARISKEANENFENAISNIINEHKMFFESDKNFDSYNVINHDLKNLRKNIFETTNTYQAKVFNTFLVLQASGKIMKANIDASKHSVEGMGKNTTSLLIALNKVDNIRSKGVVGYENKMSYENGDRKLLGHYYDGLLKVERIIQSNPNLFISANKTIWGNYNTISNQIYNSSLEDNDLGDKLEKTFYSYLMSGFPALSMNAKEKSDLINKFPKEYLEFKSKAEDDYYILDQLQIRPGEKRNYIALTNKTNSSEYNERMINSWNELMKYNPEFSEKLVKYSFLTSGFNQSTTSFYKFIPPNFFIQNGFNQYLKDYSNELSNSSDNSFIDQFYLNNLDDSQIVKYRDESVIDRKLTGKVFGSVIIPRETKKFIKIGDKYYKNIGVTKKGNNVYSQFIKTEDGYAKIAPIVSKDKKGFKVYNFNKEGVKLKTSELTESQIKSLDSVYNLVNPIEDLNTKEEILEQSKPPVVIETKQEVKSEVSNMNELTNHSGGAKGYDAEWDLIGAEFGMINNKHYLLPSDGAVSDSRLQAKGVKPVDATNDVGPVALQGPATGEAQIAVTNAERAMGRIEPNHTTRNTKKIRNYAQVKNADAIFAIGSLIPKGADITVARGQATKKALVPQVNGGTSVAVQLGITMNKPTYVFNQVANNTYSQGWYKWDNTKQDFVSINTPTLTKNFAGIGTSSNTTEVGKQAIRDVYQETKNSLSKIEKINDNIGDTTFTPDEINKINIYARTGKNVEISQTDYTKNTASDNPNIGFIFTENAEMLGSNKNVSMTQAVIRTDSNGNRNQNALAIITKKLQVAGEKGQWKDTEEDFNEFKKLNSELIQSHKNSNYTKLVFPKGFATDKAKLPTRFVEWLKKELLDNFGLVTELNSTKTGLISKSVNDNLGDTIGKQLTLFEPLTEEEQQKLKEIKEICKPKR